MTIKPTEEQKKQVRDIMDECQNKLAAVIGAPVSVLYRLKINHINPEIIIQHVLRTCNVRHSQLVSQSREKELVVARYLIIWLVTYYCGISSEKVAAMVNRERSSVPHAIAEVNDKLDVNDEMYVKPLKEIERLLLNNINDAA
jgi:chromosomal replication initiation ATPase DnaA